MVIRKKRLPAVKRKFKGRVGHWIVEKTGFPEAGILKHLKFKKLNLKKFRKKDE